jgi:hypothetical protein
VKPPTKREVAAAERRRGEILGQGLALASGIRHGVRRRRRTATRQTNRSVALRFIAGIGARFRARSGCHARLRQALACARYAADPDRRRERLPS